MSERPAKQESEKVRLGNRLAAEGRQAEAERAFREAIAEGDPHANVYLAVLLGGQEGREAEAEQALRAALAANHEEAHLPLGLLLAVLPGRRPEGCDHLRGAVELGSGPVEVIEELCEEPR